MNFKFLKFLAQLRLGSKFILKITIGCITYKINPPELCSLCSLHEQEDLYHVLISCPVYSSLRAVYLCSIINDIQYFEFPLILQSPSKRNVINLFNFFVEALKLRSFMLND